MDALKMPGLATGLDTTSIIQQLMAVERRPVNMLQQSQATMQSRLDAYRSINTKLMALQTAAKNVMGVSQNLSAFNNKTATSSNTAQFTATASSTAQAGTYSIKVNSVATTQVMSGATKATGYTVAGAAFTLGIKNTGTGAVTNVNITAGMTLQDAADAINQAGGPATATVMTAGGNQRLILTAKDVGTNNGFSFSGTTAANLAKLGLSGVGFTNTAATNASISVNGGAAIVNNSSNTYTSLFTGVDLTLATGATAGTTASLTVAPDSSTAVNNVKDLVAKFNDVVNAIKDATKYDANTKKGGVLAGDAFITDLQAKLTSMVTGTFDGRAYAGGATPGLRNYTDVGLSIQRDGTLTLDETKLKSAMTTYAAGTATSASVYQLFANEDGAMNGSTKLNNFGNAGGFADGIANRIAAFTDMMISPTSLYNSPNAGGRYNGAFNERINSFTNQIKDYDTKISQYNLRLDQYQTFLQNQFTNMEKVVNQLRSQGSYLAGQTGSSNG